MRGPLREHVPPASSVRWGVGGVRARVRFSVSWERRSWAHLVVLIFGEPSVTLAARERARRARGECWRVEAPPCSFGL